MSLNLDAQLARISEVTAIEPVQIVHLMYGFDWWCWLCSACLEIWISRGWTVLVKKDPIYPLTCYECGRDDAKQQEPAQAA